LMHSSAPKSKSFVTAVIKAVFQRARGHERWLRSWLFTRAFCLIASRRRVFLMRRVHNGAKGQKIFAVSIKLRA